MKSSGGEPLGAISGDPRRKSGRPKGSLNRVYPGNHPHGGRGVGDEGGLCGIRRSPRERFLGKGKKLVEPSKRSLLGLFDGVCKVGGGGMKAGLCTIKEKEVLDDPLGVCSCLDVEVKVNLGLGMMEDNSSFSDEGGEVEGSMESKEWGTLEEVYGNVMVSCLEFKEESGGQIEEEEVVVGALMVVGYFLEGN